LARSSRGSFRGRPVGRQRKKSWDEGPGSTAATAISTSSATILGSGALAVNDGQTILRTRGLLALTMLTAGSLGDGFFGAFGIGIVTEQAFSIGITAMPAPVAEADWDGWLYHTFVDVRTGLNPGANASSFQKLMVDSKAMRKINQGETIFAALEVVEVGVATLDAHFDSRVLVALP